MSEKKDLVVKMTINSTDFDNGLKNAKSSMQRFETSTFSAKKTIQSFVGGAIKGFTALGVAVTAKEMFTSFMHSTQTMGDKWENAMAACKTSWQSFQSEIILNGGAAVTRLNEMYREAKKLADLMDQYGSAQISQDYASLRYEPIISEAITQYKEAKKSGNQEKMDEAYNKASKALEEYVSETNKTIDAAKAAAIQFGKTTIGIADINENNFWSKFDTLYQRINRGELSDTGKLYQQYASMSDQEFRSEVWAKSHPTFQSGKYSIDMPDNPIQRGNYALRTLGYSSEAIAAAESEYRQSEVIDEKLQSQIELLKNYAQLNQHLDSWKRKVLQMTESTTGPYTTTTKIPTASTSQGLNIDQLMEYYIRQMERVPLPLPQYQELELPEENIIEPETDMIVESVTKKMEDLVKRTQEAYTAADSLGNAFNALGSLAGDNTFGKIASGLGGMISQATSATKAMMLLAGAETVEGLAETFAKAPVLTKIALTATALAGVLGIIASAKNAFAGSFAEGGVVGGTSYTGDKLLARVNSGEMIVPYKVWHGEIDKENSSDSWARIASIVSSARTSFAGSFADGGVVGGTSYTGDKLLARVNSGELILPYDKWNNASSGNVTFVIEGSQLKGVLDNYESINNM